MRKTAVQLLSVSALALSLAACADNSVDRKANAAIPASTVALMAEKGVTPADPVMMRIVKADSKLEVWKKLASGGKYTLIKSYDICRWSGDLGPKVSEGDRQAPEGFYNITPAQMNPNSSYYLSFNTGFPNAFDRAYGRSGSHLMVHGDCSSRGCYAMTDAQMGEIYAIAREAFRGGQRAFQLQALPFKMTAKNMFKFRNSPHYAFWQNLKEGVDQFEVSGLEPKVDVCGKKYVFNASPKMPGAQFDPASPCPAYEVAPEIASALQDYKAREQEETQALMQEELHKTNGGKLASMLGLNPPKASKIDPIANPKLIDKESAKDHLPSSAPEAVSLLALRHDTVPEEVTTTASLPAQKQAAPAVKPVKTAAIATPLPAREVRGNTSDDAAYTALMSNQTLITGSLGQFLKSD